MNNWLTNMLHQNLTTKSCRYYKMKVLDNHKKEAVNETIAKKLDEQSIVFSDKSTSYVDIADLVETHIMEKSTKERTDETLKMGAYRNQ